MRRFGVGNLGRAQVLGRYRLDGSHAAQVVESEVLHDKGCVMDTYIVIGALGRHRVDYAHPTFQSGVVHGNLQPLDLHGEFLRTVTQFLGRPPAPLGQEIAYARPLGDQLDHLEH